LAARWKTRCDYVSLGRDWFFISDRGSQYSSHVVLRALELIGASLSMSAQGNCYDNAKAEAFFSTLKAECFPSGNVFSSKVQARRPIFEHIETYYNNQRLHSAIGYQSPRLYEAINELEKSTFSKEKVTATLCAEGGAKVKQANGINGRGPRSAREAGRLCVLCLRFRRPVQPNSEASIKTASFAPAMGLRHSVNSGFKVTGMYHFRCRGPRNS
jgi:Integrase core domain